MIYLALDDVLAIACEVLQLDADEILRVTDLGAADSAVARPQAGFGDEEFYPTIGAKSASLLFGVARNRAFIDGNKRIAVRGTPRPAARAGAVDSPSGSRWPHNTRRGPYAPLTGGTAGESADRGRVTGEIAHTPLAAA